MTVKIKRLHPAAVLPVYQSAGSAGADIHACLESELTLAPQEIKLIPTGFAMEIPAGYEAQVRPRSGLATKGITVVNTPGTIDSDYRGEVKVIVANIAATPFVLKPGDRIAQMVIAPVAQASFEFADELSDTSRGAGGFGSTGVGHSKP